MEVSYSLPDYAERYHVEHSPIRECARPFCILHEKRTSRAAVLIHGYAGYPAEMGHLALSLYDRDIDVFVPRLPGMGTSGRDFLETDHEMWKSTVFDCIGDVSHDYDEIVLCGHSMGCFIAQLACSRFSISRLALACPPYIMRTCSEDDIMKLDDSVDSPLSWQSLPGYDTFPERSKEDDEYLGREYWSHMYARMMKEFFILDDEATSAVPLLSVPTFALTCRNDALVSDSSSDVLRNAPCQIERLSFPTASHYILYDAVKNERDMALSAVTAWLSI